MAIKHGSLTDGVEINNICMDLEGVIPIGIGGKLGKRCISKERHHLPEQFSDPHSLK